MFKLASIALVAASLSASVSAFTLNFHNNCGETVWPAVGKAPYGKPDPSVAFGAELAPGKSTSFSVADSEVGIRSWGRTGCDSEGANCQTGACKGGLKCTDGGITAGVLYGEYGYQQQGNVISWDLSHVDASVNLSCRITDDGNTKECASVDCPADQAFNQPKDYGAITTSPVGSTFDITFCY